MNNKNATFSSQDLAFFNENGYVIAKKFASSQQLDAISEAAHKNLTTPTEPWELESQLQYPGAAKTLTSPGGKTIRRLLQAYQRDDAWQAWATHPKLHGHLSQLFGQEDISLVQSHHNCLMTKSDKFSSDTGWHQDIRYWSFESQNLITAWLALGTENAQNGGIQIIPGSHKINFSSEQFDDQQFFKFQENKQDLQAVQSVELNAGDVLFFHAKTLHCASRNHTQKPKLALVFTYKTNQNKAISGTRSAGQESITLGPVDNSK